MRNAKFWIAGLALLLGTRVSAQTTPTAPPTPAQVIAELTQAFVDAGVDPTVMDGVAPVLQLVLARAQLQKTLDNSTAQGLADLDTKESSDVANLNAAIAAISNAPGPAGPQGIPGAPGAPGPSVVNYAVPSKWTWKINAIEGGCSYNIGSDATVIPPLGVPIFCDYLVPIPQDGTYTITAHLSITSGSAPVIFHYEWPVGTTVATNTYQPTGTSAAFVPVSATLAHGLNMLRFSYDKPEPGNLTNSINFFTISKQ